ncbi:CheR family methyltransferase [Methylophaga sp. OBS4]|uniref:CheR family methyltransferase n=1 Tax=Methylophaga sp. OBS4 TaxID=2991935 RepID=UPI00224E1EB2|nr:protein-glutamate O-methyltransferase CheR [Methylophaga sp. OBS4]MCX4187112.1 protein-glutamate O-methyltransferase CheR [Methylophaga sp. OBS4]
MDKKFSLDDTTIPGAISVSDEEIALLLEAIYDKYGYDFRSYSRAHVRRRLVQRLRLSQLESLGMLQYKALHDPDFIALLLKDFSINVTEMFRDPDFYLAVREKVVPLLKTWSYIKIWHAGCSTGEEVYSMAIMLKEEHLDSRVQIYATDFNSHALAQAREGIFPAENMKTYARNYQSAGAIASFSDYYHAKYDSAIMDPSLKKNILWANHNLVTDSDFAEVHMVVCRNVLIYFNRQLQNSVHKLFHRSLVNGGILCLGKKETLSLTDYKDSYSDVDRQQKIYKKNYEYPSP